MRIQKKENIKKFKKSNIEKIQWTSMIKVLCLVSLFIGSGCAKNILTSEGPSSDSNVSPYYSTTDLQGYVSKTSREIGIPIYIADTKKYDMEHHYFRVLNLLLKNNKQLQKHRDIIEKIVVGGGETSSQQNLGRYNLFISLMASELELIDLVSFHLPAVHRRDLVEREFRAAVPLNLTVRDLYGFSVEEIPAVARNLNLATSDVDFNNDRKFTHLYLSNYFAIVPEGMVIDIRANSKEISRQLVEGITARRMWVSDVETSLVNLALNMTYQAGSFTGEELIEAIQFVKRSANTIKSITSNSSKFFVGKKFDYNLQNGEILLNYKASEKEITTFLLATVPQKVILNFDSAKLNILQAFAKKNLNLEQIVFHLQPSEENLSLLRFFTDKILPGIDTAKMNELGVKVLHFTLTGSTSMLSSSVIFIQLQSLMEARFINDVLVSSQIRWTHEDLLRDLQSYSSTTGINVTTSNGIIPSFQVNTGLAVFIAWIQSKNTEYWVNHKIDSMVLIFDQTTTTQVKNNILIVNLVDFDKEKIEKILK